MNLEINDLQNIQKNTYFYNGLITEEFEKKIENMSYNREDREMFDAKCGDCGTDCQVPFQPKQDRPVYCRECFQNHKPEPRQGGRFGGRSGGNDRGSRFGRRDERPREMHDAKCGDCGNDCQVPFQPKEDRPVYCRDCFQNHR
ncbi:MAG: hypothetical protein NZ747_03510 [Nitrosopumilus sp.]|nr:hypothetical protein [Nitrosopumilus sp.]